MFESEPVSFRRIFAMVGFGSAVVRSHGGHPLGNRSDAAGLHRCWFSNNEDVATLFAFDLIADINAANAQQCLTTRARHRDPLDGRRRLRRSLGLAFRGSRAAGLIRRLGTERTLAVLADDFKADVFAVDLQRCRAMRTIRSEVLACLAHELCLSI